MNRLFLAVAATGLLMTLDGAATLVADFETSVDYKNSRAKSSDTPTGDTWDYSDTTPLLNDANGQSGTIYGGVITTWSVSQDYNPWVLKNPNDGFVAHVTPPDKTGTQSVTGAYLWHKADFLTGASDTVQFNAGDTISYHFNWMTGGNQEVRLIVKQGGITYVSEWWTAGYQNITHDPSTTNWAVLDTANYTWGDFSPLTLDDIEGAGLYFTLSVTGDQCAARLLDFQIDATVVAAPGTDEMVVDYFPSALDAGGRAPDIETLNGDTATYSETTPLFDDSDLSGQNGRFYGGYVTTWSIEKDYTPGRYHASANEGFTIQNWANNGSDTSITAVYLWDKADFLAGSSDIVQFNAGSSIFFDFSWLTWPTAPDPPHQLRLVAKQAGTTYISEWSTTDHTENAKNPTATNWAELDTTNYTWGDFSPVTFDDVEGVGMYYTLSRTAANTATRMTGFQVTARVIPDAGGDKYASWATANGIGGEPFDGDFNNDGIANGVAYALGLSPTTPSQPAGVLSGDTITYSKGAEAIANADVTWIIETSTTLEAGSWTVVETQAPGDANTTISYTLPHGGPAREFARLRVEQEP